MIARISCLFFCLLIAMPAWADDYAKPTLDNLVKTLVRFSAIDTKDDRLLDEYAMITDCDLVKYFYVDDFRWNKVRQSFRDSIQMNIATFPVSYFYDTTLQLDRFDFGDKVFRFTAKTALHNVNSFLVYDAVDAVCGNRKVKSLPLSYHMVLDQPIEMTGLPLTEADAQALLKRMDVAGNKSRLIYARFNIHVVYIEALSKTSLAGRDVYSQMRSAQGNPREAHIDVRLDSADFYEDKDMTKLIYSYRS